MFALLQGPTQLARWTFSYPMRQFLNAFPLGEGGGQRPGWMCLAEAQICAADLFRKMRGAILRLRRAPSLWGCSLGTVQHWLLHRCGESILRLWRGPSPRAYSVSMLGVFLPYETVLKRVPPLENGAAKGRDGCASLRHKSAQQILLSPFYDLLISHPTASRIHPAPLARPFSKGLLS